MPLKLILWEVDLTWWEVDLLGLDLVGVDFVRVDLMGLTLKLYIMSVLSGDVLPAPIVGI